MSIIDHVQMELQHEQKIYNQICKELRKIPLGTLSVAEVKSKKYFTAHFGEDSIKIGNINGRANTPKARKIISELTARYCIQKMKQSIENNKKLLEAVVKGYMPYDPNILIPAFPKAYKDITDGIFNHTGFIEYAKWSDDTPVDDFRNDERIHRTISGIMVRSKGEVAIADNYTMRGDLYIYEKKLILPDGTVLHPDFTILLTDYGKEKYHEHLGMPENPEYVKSFLWKLSKYMEFGIYPNKNLLITIEEPGGGIDMENLNDILDWFLKY